MIKTIIRSIPFVKPITIGQARKIHIKKPRFTRNVNTSMNTHSLRENVSHVQMVRYDQFNKENMAKQTMLSGWMEFLKVPKSDSLVVPSQIIVPENTKSHDLVLKRMADSYIEHYLSFKNSPELLEEYLDPVGEIRIGKILEDIDFLAESIGYKHCGIDPSSGNRPLTILTASVDRLDVIKPIQVCDIRLSGHVIYTGYSSMETGGREPKKLFQMGEQNRRIASAAKALKKAPPTEEERVLHELFVKYSNFADPKKGKQEQPDDFIWMEDTGMNSVASMQPIDRHTHGFVFGGYLMRLAYELAFSNASVFLRSQPKFLAMDEISFKRPVPIGSILTLSSQVVYAPGPPHNSFTVSVTADMVDIQNSSHDTSNIFHFNFRADNAEMIRKVIPKTYGESMKFLEGKRRREEGLRLRGLSSL
ncbi:HotDog domain-containing protein [Glomus cerebriforme]|uniref:HotDog domain-containing protein n=1 Tax=Glomus cerebriforme TaxID=658196 RepID=A0A397SBJ7_9GLOM|nr:HotDog domain-containing protein [Glomus cerebriforme]